MKIPNQLLLLLESLNFHLPNNESRFEIEHAQCSFNICLDYERLDLFNIEGKANLLINFDFEKVFKPSNFRKFFLDDINEYTFQERIASRLCNNINEDAFKRFGSDPWEMLHEQADNFFFQFLVFDKILKTKEMKTIKWEDLFCS